MKIKAIKDYEKYYAISNTGEVWMHSKVWKAGKGAIRETDGKYMKKYIDKNGYEKINLRKNSKYKCFLVHRLVANAFILNPENKPQINHKDGNKLNNNSNNLEWCTNKENLKHACIIGLMKKRRKLSKDEIISIRKSTLSDRLLAKIYFVSRTTINSIKNKKTYKEI